MKTPRHAFRLDDDIPGLSPPTSSHKLTSTPRSPLRRQQSVVGQPVALRKVRSYREAGHEAKSAFVGSVTELQSVASRRSSIHVHLSGGRRENVDPGSVSMSSAPVETLVMSRLRGQRRASNSHLEGPFCRLCTRISYAIYPERGRVAVPPDVILFLLILGVASGLLGSAQAAAFAHLHIYLFSLTHTHSALCIPHTVGMDWAISLLIGLRESAMYQVLVLFNETRPPMQWKNASYNHRSCSSEMAEIDVLERTDEDDYGSIDPACISWGCTFVHAIVWFGYSLALCYMAIYLTAKVAPQAAGSGAAAAVTEKFAEQRLCAQRMCPCARRLAYT